MIHHDDAILDNPVWHALQSVHQSFALGSPSVKRYPNNILTIAGFENPLDANLNDIAEWTTPGEKIFIVGKAPIIPENWTLAGKLDCVQMVCNKLIRSSISADVVALSADDHPEMFDLINRIQPGYYHADTPLLGDYFGIRQGGKLVAMAGERLRITGFTEISAVATDPAFTGRGFASQLVAHVVGKNIQDGTVPFLHFLNSNTRAQKVYELLGFKTKCHIPFWGINFNG